MLQKDTNHNLFREFFVNLIRPKAKIRTGLTMRGFPIESKTEIRYFIIC